VLFLSDNIILLLFTFVLKFSSYLLFLFKFEDKFSHDFILLSKKVLILNEDIFGSLKLISLSFFKFKNIGETLLLNFLLKNT